MISTTELSSKYEIQDQNYGQQFQKQFKIEKAKKKGQNDDYIIFDLNQIKLNSAKKKILRRIKYIGIQQPYEIIMHKNERYLVFKDILKFQLTKQKLIEQEIQGCIRILIQILLAYIEFEYRRLEWQIQNLSQIYLIEGIVQFLIIDYVQDENQNSRNNKFKAFILQNFEKLNISEILNKNEDDRFQKLLNQLLYQLGNVSISQEIQGQFEQEMRQLFYINNAEILKSRPYCLIKKFITPINMQKILLNPTKEMVFKQKKFQKNNKYYEHLITNIDREIEINEKNNEYKQLVPCICYFRIQDRAFLFMKAYKYTLDNIFQLWNDEKPKFSKLQVYHLCNSFATALFELQLSNLIHRDLKPQNVFLMEQNDNNDLSWNEKDFIDIQIIIADFDRSKFISNFEESETQLNQKSQQFYQIQQPQLIQRQDQSQFKQKQKRKQMTSFNSENTERYDPPEQNETQNYDVWQYGVICYQIANKGEFPGCDQGGRGLEDQEYEDYYSLQTIKKQLSHTDYPQEFLSLIADCLKKDYKSRPSPEKLHKIMENLFFSEQNKNQINISQM